MNDWPQAHLDPGMIGPRHLDLGTIVPQIFVPSHDWPQGISYSIIMYLIGETITITYGANDVYYFSLWPIVIYANWAQGNVLNVWC